MNQNQSSSACPDANGTMPSCAPLAVPYVPFQQEDAKRYNRMEALSEGALFPGLNLPFHLKQNGRDIARCPRTELMALSFIVLELGLYLDTHPDDEEAFRLYRRYVELLEQGRRTYVEQIGPLEQIDSAMDDSYTWVNAPWPWQQNSEG